MKKSLIILLLISVTHSVLAMEDPVSQDQFLTTELQKEWAQGIKQMVEWSQGLPNRTHNTIIKVYELCHNKLGQLQTDNQSNILQAFPEEIALAKELLTNIKDHKNYIKELKTTSCITPYYFSIRTK